MSKRLSIALPVALSISLLMATDSFAQKLTKRPSSTVEIGSGTAPAGGAIPAPTEGRLPVLGDVLRVGCFSPQYQEGRIGEGVFEGAVGGLLLLRQSRSVGVPVENVRRVEIRERRSHKGLGRVVGAFLGALVGGGMGAPITILKTAPFTILRVFSSLPARSWAALLVSRQDRALARSSAPIPGSRPPPTGWCNTRDRAGRGPKPSPSLRWDAGVSIRMRDRARMPIYLGTHFGGWI